MKPVILFDLDGTLIDSTEAILEGFRVAFETFGGQPPCNEAIKKEIGHTLEDMFLTLGVEEHLIKRHVDAYKRHYRLISCEKTQLLEGAREAIEEASQFATLGVVTTKTGEYSTILLEHMDLMRYFDLLIGREHVTNPKPHPEPILEALKRLEYDKNRTWMVGDTPMDILSANRADIKSIAVTSGYATKESLEKYASNICNSAKEAVLYIKNHEQKIK